MRLSNRSALGVDLFEHVVDTNYIFDPITRLFRPGIQVLIYYFNFLNIFIFRDELLNLLLLQLNPWNLVFEINF